MEYSSKIIGETICLLRLKKRMTQEELSGLAGISRSHLAMIENNRKRANVGTLWNIATALNIRLSTLFDIVERRIEAQEEK